MERTSSFVSASDVIPLTRTAKRSATRSSQPHRRSRPVTVPNSPSELAHALLGFAFDLARERALAHARHVRLGDADDLVDPIRTDPEADRRAGGDRAGRGDERVGAVVEVEQRPLGALEQDASTGVQRAGRRAATCPPRREPVGRRVAERPRARRRRVERLELVHALQPDVLLGHGELDLLAQDLRVEQVLHANPDSRRLVGVGRADPAPRRADLQGAESPLARAVECDVPGHDQVRVAGDEDKPRRRAAARLQLVELRPRAPRDRRRNRPRSRSPCPGRSRTGSAGSCRSPRRRRWCGRRSGRPGSGRRGRSARRAGRRSCPCPRRPTARRRSRSRARAAVLHRASLRPAPTACLVVTRTRRTHGDTGDAGQVGQRRGIASCC